MRNESTRNPIWDRDETILALNLFLQCKNKVPDKTDERVIKLSELLRGNPFHASYADRKNFRSPSAVVMKLSNLQQEIDGHGMPNNSRTDRAVCGEFLENPDKVALLARSIAIAMSIVANDLVSSEDDEDEFYEGRAFTRVHIARERNPKLRKKVLEDRIKNGKLHCEICDLRYHHLPEALRSAAFEAHHLVPLAGSGPRLIRVKDMALLCATCHRLIHRLIADRKTWVPMAEARERLLKTGY